MVAFVAMLGLSIVPSRALGETSAEVADRMFREAKKAMDAGDYPRACPLFEESQRLDPGGGTLMNLGLCQEKLGKLATAQKTFELAANRARSDGRADRLGEAHAHLAALAPRVPTLTLVTARTNQDRPHVTVDGRAIAPEELGQKIPLDPGAHSVRIEVRPVGTDGQTISVTTKAVELREGENARLALEGEGSDLPSPVPEPPKALDRNGSVSRQEGGTAAPAPASASAPAPTLDVGARPEASFSVASWVSFGVAATGLGTAAITGLMALSARSDYAEKCFDDRGYCVDASARESGDRARSLAWVSTVSLGVGVVGLWTGLLLPRRYPVTVTPNGAGLSVRGAF
jgi:hypothetical protein